MGKESGNPLLEAISNSRVGFEDLTLRDFEKLSQKPGWDSILISQKELYRMEKVRVAAKRVGGTVLIHFVGPKKKLKKVFQTLADQF